MGARLRVVLQSDRAECGLACLAMILGHFGVHTPLTDLRRRFPISLKGSTLRGILRIAEQLGLSARPVRLDIDELGRLQTPALLHWGLNHFVVLEHAGRQRPVIVDPAAGRRSVAPSELSDLFTGVAVEFTVAGPLPTPPRPQAPRLRELVGRIDGLWAALSKVFALSLALELLGLAIPLANQVVVDNAISSGDVELIPVCLIAFGLLVVIQALFSAVRAWMVTSITQAVGLQWSGNVFRHLVALPTEFFEKRHLGDIASRFGSVSAIQRLVTTGAVETGVDGLLALLALGLMVWYSWHLALISVVSFLVYAVARLLYYLPVRALTAERLSCASRENSFFLETLRSIPTVKLFGIEDDRLARWKNLTIDLHNRDFRLTRYGSAFAAFSQTVAGVENLAVLGVAGYAIVGGAALGTPTLTIGMLMAYMAYKGQFSRRSMALVNYLVELRMLRLHAERLADIVNSDREAFTQSPMEARPTHETVELRGVSFRYSPEEPWVLRNVDVAFRPGEAIAITGPSGSGKSTLIRIVLGLLKPTEGKVLYGGTDVWSQGMLARYRSVVGAVLQDDVLLTGSIYDNVSMFGSDVGDADVRASCALARISDEIEKMPMRYHTLVGDLGTGLSGGQKQRLFIARALARQPHVLVLDEATSHLDYDNEREVVRSISRTGATKIVVAHRLETLRSASRLFRLADGLLLEAAAANSPANLQAFNPDC